MTIIRDTTIHSKVTAGNDYSLKLRTLYMYKRRPKGFDHQLNDSLESKDRKPRPSKNDHSWFRVISIKQNRLRLSFPRTEWRHTPLAKDHHNPQTEDILSFRPNDSRTKNRTTTIMISVRIHIFKQDKVHYDIENSIYQLLNIINRNKSRHEVLNNFPNWI